MGKLSDWPARDPWQWFSECISGTVTAFVVVALSGSFGLLIFGNQLAAYTGFGVTMSLVTAVLVGGYLAIRSGYCGLIAIPHDRIAPILAFLATSVTIAMPQRPIEEIIGTVVAAIAVAGVLTGVTLYALGQLKLGNLIRFIPYPVVGGFLAGSGWLLCAGSVHAMTGLPTTLMGLLEGFKSGSILLWLPCAAFGLGVFYFSLKMNHWAVLPGSILAGIIVFYIWLTLTSDRSITFAREQGWLLGSLGTQKPFDLTPIKMLAFANPWILFSQVGTFAAVAITSLVSILLNSSAIELDTNQEADLNNELRHSGLVNAFTGLAGGLVGFTSLSLTRLSREMGGRTRLSGLFMALICAACFCMGTSFVGFIPKFILGGLLFFLGLRFLNEWVIEAWSRLPKLDYAAVMLILAVIATAGYLQGVTVGLVAAALLFVVNYSQVRVVSSALDATQQRSSVDRSLSEEKFLREEGRKVQILKLQGFLFFGSANNLLLTVRSRQKEPSAAPLKFVVLDFKRVHGLDSSAVLALRKLQCTAAKSPFTIIFCNLTTETSQQIRRAGLSLESSDHVEISHDLDHALELCEDLLLKENPTKVNEGSLSLEDQMKPFWPVDGPPFSTLMPFLEYLERPAGNLAIAQGDDSNELLFIHRGRVTAQLRLQNGKTARLRTMSQGTVVGELGLYLNEPRSASIVTDEPCILYRLTREELNRMQKENPELASSFHHFMTCILADRMSATTNSLRSILE